MYFISFTVKILLKCVFPKVVFLKFKTDSDIHYPSERGEINCIESAKTSQKWTEERFSKK